MAEVASAYVALLPSFKGGASAISRELGGSLDGAGRDGGAVFGGGMRTGIAGMATKIFAPLAAAAGAVSLGNFFKGAVEEASGLGESVNALNVVFGDASTGVQEIGAAAASNLGLSNLDFNNLAVQFSNFAKTVAGPGGDVTKTLGDITGRAADFASVMNLDVAEAASLFQSGLAGETEPLRRYGIDLSAASVQAYAYANGIGTAGTELTEAQKVQSRYGLLMQSTAQAQGDFANTSNSLANQQRILGASWDNLSGKLGGVFLPVVSSVVGFLTTTVVPAISRVVDTFTGAGGGIAGATAVWQQAVSWIGGWLAGSGMQTIVDGLVAGRERMVGLILTLIPQLVDILAASLPGMVSWITTSLIPMLLDTIMQIIPALVAVIPVLVSAITTAAPMLLDAAVQIISALISGIAEVLPVVVTALLGLLPQIIGALLGMLPDLIDTAIELFGALIDALVEVIPDVITSLMDMLPGVITTLLGMLPRLIQTALTLFMSLVQGLVQALPQLLTAILNALPLIITALLTMLPDIIMAAVDLFIGLVTGLLEMLPQLIDTLINVVLPNLLTTLVAMVPQLLEAAVTLFTALLDALIRFTPQLIGMVIELIPQIVGGLISGIGQLLAAGGELIGALWDGAIAKWNEVLAWFGGLGSGVLSALSGVGDSIMDAFKTAFNAVAGFWNDTIGSISFEVPDWLPGPAYSWSFPQIPLLADGALATGPTLAMIGEGGTEALLPFSRVAEFAAMVADRLGPVDGRRGRTNADPIDYDRLARAMANVTIGLDGHAVSQSVDQRIGARLR